MNGISMIFFKVLYSLWRGVAYMEVQCSMGPKKNETDFQDLELQAVMHCLTWILRTEHRQVLTRTVKTLDQ